MKIYKLIFHEVDDLMGPSENAELFNQNEVTIWISQVTQVFCKVLDDSADYPSLELPLFCNKK